MTPGKIKTEKFNPYPGLRPYKPEESDLFFGREEESELVLRKLLSNRFVTVIGASGIGKSSLIYCGVLPKILKQSQVDSSSWQIISFRPGNDPVGNLTEAFVANLSDISNEAIARQSVTSNLKVSPDGISLTVKDLINGKKVKVLMVVDQLEELFRYRSTCSGAIPGEKAAEFVTLLENAVYQTSVEIYTIITIRSDFISECTQLQGLTQLINRSNYLVPHMSRENYRAAIEGPVKFAGDVIDLKLVEIILDDIGDQTDLLPVLQHALMRTWIHWQELDEPDKPVSISDYNSAGTMTDAMSLHAEEAFEELSCQGKEICEKIFKTITKKGTDNKGSRHPSSLKAIKYIINCTDVELFEVVEKFRIASRSFITPVENIQLSDDTVIDLSCDSLMRQWDRLKEWIDDEAASVQMYLRLSEASAMYQQGKTKLMKPPDLQLAIKWREKQKPSLTWAERYDPAFERAMVYLRTSEKEYLTDEENKIMLQKRKIKRTRVVAFIFGVVVVISLGFMQFAFVQKISADRQTVLAEARRVQEERQKLRADSLFAEANRQRILADSVAAMARQKVVETMQQKEIAVTQRKLAEKNTAEALNQQNIAIKQSDSAKRASIIADQNAKIANDQNEESIRLRMLSIGKSMSMKSMQLQGQKDLQTLLAYQAYLFNQKNKGLPNDADIYQGLYDVAKKYGNVNYKTFTGHTGEIKSIAFIPGKREFYTSGTDRKVFKWNLDNKNQNLQVIYSGAEIIEVLAASPDAGWLACGGLNPVIKMIPLKPGNIGYELKGHTGKIKSLVFSYDGKYLYSASLDGKVLKWDLAARTSINVADGSMQIISIDLSSNGNYLAGVSNDGKALIWNPDRSSDNFRIEKPGKTIKMVRFKPEENTLAIGYSDGFLELWDVAEKKKISEVKAHTAEINDIRFNNRMSQMATGSNDGTLKIWDIRDLTNPPVNFNDNEGFVIAIGYSPDGQLVVSGTSEGNKNLIGRPSYADILAQDICKILTRNLSADEWTTYVGKDIKYEKTCSEYDYNIKVNVIR